MQLVNLQTFLAIVEQRSLLATRNEYAAHMAAAQAGIETGDVASARRHLDAADPAQEIALLLDDEPPVDLVVDVVQQSRLDASSERVVDVALCRVVERAVDVGVQGSEDRQQRFVVGFGCVEKRGKEVGGIAAGAGRSAGETRMLKADLDQLPEQVVPPDEIGADEGCVAAADPNGQRRWRSGDLLVMVDLIGTGRTVDDQNRIVWAGRCGQLVWVHCGSR